jgi:hypothetical protein
MKTIAAIRREITNHITDKIMSNPMHKDSDRMTIRKRTLQELKGIDEESLRRIHTSIA